jgi:predicted RNase H-like HicB family nuclease
MEELENNLKDAIEGWLEVANDTQIWGIRGLGHQ